MTRFVVVLGFLTAMFLLWRPVILWESGGGREEQWGPLGYRQVWVAYTADGGEVPQRSVWRPIELVATVSLSVAAGVVAVLVLRTMDRRPPPPEPVEHKWQPGTKAWH